MEIRRPNAGGRRKPEIRRPNAAGAGGWVFYDGDCGFCLRWAHRLAEVLNRRGFRLAPLQAPWMRERLQLDPSAPLTELRLLLADGRAAGGAEAIVAIARHIWWACPLFLFAKLPGAMPVLRAGYRWVAARRNCLSHCPNGNGPHNPRQKLGTWRLRFLWSLDVGAWSFPLWDWIPLVVFSAAAFLVRGQVPSWAFMWLFAFALFLGCKWLTWRRACRSGSHPSVARSLGYLLAWPGMDAPSFLAPGSGFDAWNLKFLWSLDVGAWSFATAKTVAGTGLIWLAASLPSSSGPFVVGWLAMIGLVLFLHFGLFDLLALAWRRAGVAAKPVMRAPLLAMSLADFWSQRWNTAFHTLAHELAFRPLVRRWGAVRAILGVFLISGLVHEAVISLPARGGFGLPTAYFVLQGLGVLAERSRRGRRARLGRGLRGWLFVAAFTVGPAFWLFHPPFINHVILPMLRALGAN